MKPSTVVWTIIIIIIVFGLGIYFSMSGSPKSATLPTSQTTNTTNNSQITQNTLLSATVIYGPNGFSPSSVTISKGGTVTFINQGGNEMWVASDPHPTHEGYSGTTKNQHCPDTAGIAFDQCFTGTSYSFIFEKIGAWGYHNHASSDDKGTIIVE